MASGQSQGGGASVGLLFDLRNPVDHRRPWSYLYGWHLEQIAEADRRGIGSVSFSEHHFFDDGYLPQPLTMAAAAAAVTSRVRIGSGVVLPLLRDAIHLAEEAAVVDLISDGRLDLGIGAGYRVPELEAFGANRSRRFATVEDRVQQLRRLWAETVTPPPSQDPVPIWGGFYGPRGARMSGRLGLGLLAADRRLVGEYREGLAEAGHDPDSAAMRPVVDLHLTDDPERDWPVVRTHLAEKWDTYRRYMAEGTGRETPEPIDPERWREGTRGDGSVPRFMIATPSEAARTLRAAWQGLPVVEAICWGALPGLPEPMAERHLELLAGEFAAAMASP